MRGRGRVVEDGEAMRGGRTSGVVVEERDEGGGKIHIKKGEKLNNDVLADVVMKIKHRHFTATSMFHVSGQLNLWT